MSQYDTVIDVGGEVILASYGPREYDADANVVEARPGLARFWEVRRYNAAGEDEWVADAHDEDSARILARRVADHGESQTVAFLALGVQDFLCAPGAHQECPAIVQFMTAVADIAPLLDTLARGRDLHGGFALEVARPFGRWMAEQAFAGHAPDLATVIAMVRELIDECEGLVLVHGNHP